MIAIKGLVALAILGVYQKLLQEMFFALKAMFGLSKKKTWQRALTQFIAAFLGFLVIGAIIIFFSWKADSLIGLTSAA